MSIVIAIVALSVLILVHEIGHFAAAKAVGIKVLEFSIFMGPKIVSIKRGETIYSLRLVPIGGYVKMEGEEESSDDERSFTKQPVWKRALVIAAGPAMNIIIAFIFAVIVLSQAGYSTNKITALGDNSPLKAIGAEVGDKLISYDGKRLYDPNLDISALMYGENGSPKEVEYFDVSRNQKVKSTMVPGKTSISYRLGFTAVAENGTGTNQIEMIEDNSPLKPAGVKRGDVITKIDGIPVNNTNDIIRVLNETRPNKDAPLTLDVLRDGKTYTFNDIKPFTYFQYTLDLEFEHLQGNFFGIMKASYNYSVSIIRYVFITLGWLFNGTISFRELSGPVGIIGSFGTVVQQKEPVSQIMINLLYLGALISINLGVMNLLPIPALDGSILLILLIEKLRGKPLPQEKVGMISMVGFMLLICLLIATLFNDIPRWFM